MRGGGEGGRRGEEEEVEEEEEEEEEEEKKEKEEEEEEGKWKERHNCVFSTQHTSTFSTTCFPKEHTFVEQEMVMLLPDSY